MLVSSLLFSLGGKNAGSFSTIQFGVTVMLVASVPFSSGWQKCKYLLYPSVRGGKNASSFSTLQFGMAGMLIPSIPFSSGWQEC